MKDKVILDGLTKVGFKLNDYKGGLFIKYFRDGGGVSHILLRCLFCSLFALFPRGAALPF